MYKLVPILTNAPKNAPNSIALVKHGKVKIFTGKKKMDLSVRWYVYFYYFNPMTGRMDKKWMRSFGANRFKTKKERMEILNSAKLSVKELLEEGWSPSDNIYPNKSVSVTDENEATVLDTLSAIRLAVESKSHHFSNSTLSTYKYSSRLFISWLDSNDIGGIPIEEFTRRHANRFFNYLRERKSEDGEKLSITTENNYKTMVKGIFSWLLKEEIITKNPLSGISKQRTKPKKNAPFTRSEFNRVTEWLKLNDEYLFKFITVITLEFLRSIDGCRLKVGDVSLADDLLTVDTKADDRKRKILVGQVKSILEEMDIASYPDDHFVFTHLEMPGQWDRSETGRRDYFGRRFKKCKTALGLRNELTIHSFRHTLALDLFQTFKKEGLTDLEAKMKMLPITGHNSLSGLEKYLRSIDADIPEDYSNLFSLKF